MQTYRWNSDALIEKMDVKHTVSGPEALVYPSADAVNGVSLINLPETFRSAGMTAEIKPLSRGNGVALSIRGFESATQVVEILETGGYVNPRERAVSQTETSVAEGRGR